MNSLMTSYRSHQAGLSLIELMVAILISSLLLLGVVQMFTNTSATDRTNTELARVQESGRIAMELISREVRRAGYQGCVAASVETVADGITYPDDAIQSADATSFTLNYARPAYDAAKTFPNRDCDNSELDPYWVKFSNCGTALCISATDIGNNQQLTTDTQIAGMLYGVSKGGKILWTSYADMTVADWPDVTKLQITLNVTNPKADMSRSFTSTVELRNRL